MSQASADPRDAARAIDAMRRGWPIALHAPGEPPLVLRGALGADAALLAATPLWETHHDQL